MGFTAEYQFRVEQRLKTRQQLETEQFGPSRWGRVHELGLGFQVQRRQEQRRQWKQGRWLKGLVDGATRAR